MKNFFDNRYENLNNSHNYIKIVATIFHILGDVLFWAGYCVSAIVAIINAVEMESFSLFLSIFIPSIISISLGVLALKFSCNLLFSWGESVENSKKQTELLKELIEKSNNLDQ